MTQAETRRCDCGRTLPVTRTTAHEFDWRCPCGLAGRIAWAHAQAAPTWVETGRQLVLFK